MDNDFNLNKISGFSDKFSREVTSSNQLDYKFFKFTQQWGYDRIETPIIEKTSLFSRKTGSSLASNIYNFTDPSGLDVSLRPDFTPSIMRVFLRDNDSNRETKFSYSGEIYRYESESEKNYSRQIGVEYIGNEHISSDLEILAMAIIFSNRIIDSEVNVSVGHIGILQDVVNYFELNGRVALFLLQHMDYINNETSTDQISITARENGIFFDDDKNENLGSKKSSSELSKMLDFAFYSDSRFNQTRDRDSIMNGLVRKFQRKTSKDKFIECIQIIKELINIDGDLEDSISEANKILSKIPVKDNLTNLYKLVNNLKVFNIDTSFVNINYGLVREWGYYSGFVFNLSTESNVPLGGGGRYNYLSDTLGINLSAAGFAIDSEIIINSDTSTLDIPTPKKIIVYVKEEKDLELAIKTCIEERTKGSIVSLKSSFANLEELKMWATGNEIFEIIYFENNNMNRSKI